MGRNFHTELATLPQLVMVTLRTIGYASLSSLQFFNLDVADLWSTSGANAKLGVSVTRSRCYCYFLITNANTTDNVTDRI